MSTRTRVITLVALAAVGVIPALFLLLVLAVTATGMFGGCAPDGAPSLAGPRAWTAEQAANAHTITTVVLDRHLPRRAAVLAVATAIVESGLRNLVGGDRDSLGLFQQRPSQGWGTPASILNPALATHSFLDHLVGIPRWHTLPPGAAEQLVQRSGFPERYAPQESAAVALVGLFWTGPDNPTPLPLAPAGTDSARLAVFGTGGCPDSGGSDLPLPSGDLSGTVMPPGFTPPADPRARLAVTFAAAELGKPYVWGATGPHAYDCSGLVQAAWAAAGVPISRSTTTQVHDGQPITGIDQLQPGDLLFISGDRGSAAHPGHVGLYAGTAGGEGLVIDAYDTHHGVIVEKLTTWAPKIVAVRRVAPGRPPPMSPGDPT